MNAITVERGIGDNQPPEPTPFEMVSQEIDDLYDEAKNWLDGSGVNSQDEADGIGKLINLLREAEKKAEAERVKEKKPHDDAAKTVQEKYKPILTRASMAVETAKKALAPWLAKVEAENRAKADAARKEAEEKQRIAQEALREAQASADLESREAAEHLLKQAKRADKEASRAEGAKAHATGGGRAVGLRTVYTPVLTDAFEAARHYWKVSRPEMEAFLLSLAKQDVHAGQREIPGFAINEERVAV